VQLSFYINFLSESPSDMSNLFVKYIRGTRFDYIRREICMMLHDNLPPPPAKC
jgi:hypothetical protein